MDAIVIAGQSNAEGLAPHLRALVPHVAVREFAFGGYSLLKEAAMPGAPWEYWLNEQVISQVCVQVTLADVNVTAVWWIQGETEALNGTTTEAYSDGLYDLRQRMLAQFGMFDMIVSPIGAIDPKYRFARPVLAAQYRCHERGMLLGPEYWDLLAEPDTIHLTDEGRRAFARRFADFIAGRFRFRPFGAR